MRSFVHKAAILLTCTGLLSFVACERTSSVGGGFTGGGGPTGPSSVASTGSGVPETPEASTTKDKVDLLFMIDNSRSMADKQEVLSLVVEDLIESLVNPPCIDVYGQPIKNQPVNGATVCPEGTARLYNPVKDIHIGVISSSLGGHGADACPSEDKTGCGSSVNMTNNDRGQLLARLDPCYAGEVPTYQNKRILVWDPDQKREPPGEYDSATLKTNLVNIILGVGQIGCGFESQFESWYRFLVDPEPHAKVVVENGLAIPMDVDEDLLKQRADFLRPDSLLAIVMLSDENDCSIKEFGQNYMALQLKNANNTPYRLPRPRKICETDPNDPCCTSCGIVKDECPYDPTCEDDGGNLELLNDMEDATNLRCFDQKRRFGINFLYPVERYIQALTSPVVTKRNGEVVPNPLFTDLNPEDGVTAPRGPEHVVLVGITGVPFQDIARDAKDLSKGYKDTKEFSSVDPNNRTTWDIVLGNPDSYVVPLDPLMLESIDPRQGINPVVGEPIVEPLGVPTNPMNVHEYTIPLRDDLQYTCVFDLPTPRDCQLRAYQSSCDCKDPMNDSPLCTSSPTNPEYRTLQIRGKAYPSPRQLSLLQGVNGVVASICPAQLDAPDQADYAYRPAIRAFLERMQPHLKSDSQRTE